LQRCNIEIVQIKIENDKKHHNPVNNPGIMSSENFMGLLSTQNKNR
jgi:hypothetical protein